MRYRESRSRPPEEATISLPLSTLALAAFATGTSEFVIVGLLPDLSHDLHVAIPTAGLLVTGYALGVVIGAPILAVATAKAPRKAALLALTATYAVGNALCALGDWRLMPSIAVQIGVVAVLALLTVTLPNGIAAAVTLVVWGLLTFAIATPLQMRVIDGARSTESRRDAQSECLQSRERERRMVRQHRARGGRHVSATAVARRDARVLGLGATTVSIVLDRRARVSAR